MCSIFEAEFSFENVEAIYHSMIIPVFPNFPSTLKQDQARAIHAVLTGSDVVAILPTGYGKSMIIFLPSVFSAQVIKNASV